MSSSEINLDLHCNICSTDFNFTKQYFYPSKFKTTVCPTCNPRTIRQSSGELELYEYIKSLSPDAISGHRETYHSKEIDIFVPSQQIGFEYNGLYWHSEEVLLQNNRSPKSDFEKQTEIAKKGIRLIQIFEDEWKNKQEIVKSRVANILRKTTDTIYARKCLIKEISSKEASVFCEQNHIMGRGRSNVRFGLFCNNELISVMTFSKNNLSRKVNQWELNRFSSKLGLSVIGGASRLFAAFVKTYNPPSIISYSDNRWSDGYLFLSVKPWDL